MTTEPFAAKPRPRTLVALLASLPGLIRKLVRQEIELAKAEFAQKMRRLGFALAFFAGAALALLFALAAFITLAVIGLSYVLPLWAALLIVAAALVFVAAIFILLGRKFIPANNYGQQKDAN